MKRILVIGDKPIRLEMPIDTSKDDVTRTSTASATYLASKEKYDIDKYGRVDVNFMNKFSAKGIVEMIGDSKRCKIVETPETAEEAFLTTEKKIDKFSPISNDEQIEDGLKFIRIFIAECKKYGIEL